MTRLLVTGATGFVGSMLCPELERQGYIVRAAVRTERALPPGCAEKAVVGEIGSDTPWDAALGDVDFVVHLAARAHVLNDPAANADLYTETNARGTGRLAESAARAGVKRFVYLSSIKVNGEGMDATRPYRASDPPRPADAYGTSKWLAEQHVTETAARTGMQASIVRPPLVYGPGVRANFLRLMRWVDAERLLPLGSVDNRRSLVSIWNLCDLLTVLLRHPSASATWLVSDGEDLSTPGLIRRLAHALGRRPRLVPVPVSLMRLAGTLTGRGAEVHRLCGSLTLDISPARQTLGWTPPLSVDDSLARTVTSYRKGIHNP